MSKKFLDIFKSAEKSVLSADDGIWDYNVAVNEEWR